MINFYITYDYNLGNKNPVSMVIHLYNNDNNEISSVLGFTSVIKDLPNTVTQIQKVLNNKIEEHIIEPTEDIPYMAIIVKKDFIWATEDPEHKLDTKEFLQFLQFANEKYTEFNEKNKEQNSETKKFN